jgi:YfiH family protein
VTPPLLAGPVREGETWVWKASRDGVEVRFTGRGPAGGREEALGTVEGSPPPISWAEQVHSAVALPARAGGSGEGDALVSEEAGLALCVATADCVPVLIAGPETIAAVHAGWRGIASGVVAAAVDRMKGNPSRWTAWVGPAIGACCYEVGEEVAASVAAASGAGVAVAGPAGRPHLDLPGAVRLQLEAAGVGEVIVLPRCTRCDEAALWSYRREGRRAGRNFAFIWRRP